MKFVSFNINGLRARPHQLSEIVARHAPDVIGLQETKVDDTSFPYDDVAALGYHVHFHGQKGHYGVALLTRERPVWVAKGLPSDTPEAQCRLISAELPCPDGKSVVVFNGYFPQGESREHPVKFPAKTRFYADLQAHLEQRFSPEQRLVLMGDLNISPEDCDIGIGAENARRWLRTGKCSFLPEEREWLQRLKDWGLVDTFRRTYPDSDDRFSWFDYRSRGFEAEPKRGLRIDLVMASSGLIDSCVEAGIDYDIRAMEKPSDHAPVWASFRV
ncbi:exodeoxyribonuclease III [Halopseudomonas nanhaiensis]|uniref:exodeoxyribonuclease III n=1 Tax=Halopseudomonas nanhaiensis TaxID=2830842 RepID=UPI001CBABC4B|nr:exodeoxyribonuclease III [Halopseudomonas nanhaiensis]UAW99899.1 exodeoxyribonuclease III [Halopseudomonas nanhaiensis]